MNPLWLFDTCGYIVGPAILLAGLIALALCLRASRHSATLRSKRAALIVALSPAAAGVAGAVFGLIVWWNAGGAGAPWGALGKVCLAGAVVAAVPLGWSVLLLRAGRGFGGPAPVERPA